MTEKDEIWNPDGGISLDKEFAVPTYSTVCMLCQHFDAGPFLTAGRHNCAAFADIPDEIWSGENDHTEPYPGDQGIRFEPREKPGGE